MGLADQFGGLVLGVGVEDLTAGGHHPGDAVFELDQLVAVFAAACSPPERFEASIPLPLIVLERCDEAAWTWCAAVQRPDDFAAGGDLVVTYTHGGGSLLFRERHVSLAPNIGTPGVVDFMWDPPRVRGLRTMVVVLSFEYVAKEGKWNRR